MERTISDTSIIVFLESIGANITTIREIIKINGSFTCKKEEVMNQYSLEASPSTALSEDPRMLASEMHQ